MGRHLPWILLNMVLIWAHMAPFQTKAPATQRSRSPPPSHRHTLQTEVRTPGPDVFLRQKHHTPERLTRHTTCSGSIYPEGLKLTPTLHHMLVDQRGSPVTLTLWHLNGSLILSREETRYAAWMNGHVKSVSLWNIPENMFNVQIMVSDCLFVLPTPWD